MPSDTCVDGLRTTLWTTWTYKILHSWPPCSLSKSITQHSASDLHGSKHLDFLYFLRTSTFYMPMLFHVELNLFRILFTSFYTTNSLHSFNLNFSHSSDKHLLSVNSDSQTKLGHFHSRLWSYVLMTVQKQYTKLKTKDLTWGRMSSIYVFWKVWWSFNCKNT